MRAFSHFVVILGPVLNQNVNRFYLELRFCNCSGYELSGLRNIQVSTFHTSFLQKLDVEFDNKDTKCGIFYDYCSCSSNSPEMTFQEASFSLSSVKNNFKALRPD